MQLATECKLWVKIIWQQYLAKWTINKKGNMQCWLESPKDVGQQPQHLGLIMLGTNRHACFPKYFRQF